MNEKSRLGDWEVALVIGKGQRQSIVTMVERKTKLLRRKKIDHKTGSLTRDAICAGLQGLVVQTIMSDNGREFSGHEDSAVLSETNRVRYHYGDGQLTRKARPPFD